MKPLVLFGIAGLFASALTAAAGDAKESLKKAAKALDEKPNYSWTSTPNTDGAGGRFQMTTEGKTEKGGATVLSMTAGDRSFQAAIKGEKRVIETPDGWRTLEDLRQAGGGGGGGGRGMFLARGIRNFKTPAAEAAELAEKAKELKEADGAISGDLSEAAVKELLTGGGRGGGGNAPEVGGAKGWVKFWIKDGVLAKYEHNLQGKVSFGDREFDMNRTTTVEIKNVGSTSVNVPAEAKKALE